jgi:hypothetical protein
MLAPSCARLEERARPCINEPTSSEAVTTNAGVLRAARVCWRTRCE